VWFVALIAVAGVVAASAVAVAQTAPQQVRIGARHLEDGRLEVALQQSTGADEWGERLLPEHRFVPAQARAGLWLVSSPVAVGTTHGVQELRIAARRHADGRVEVALQRQHADGTWGDRILPALRFVPAGTASGRWLASSPLAVPARLEIGREAVYGEATDDLLEETERILVAEATGAMA